MKKLYTLAILFFSLFAAAQVPQSINYQGVARNTNGAPIIGPIAVQIDIHQGSGGGPVVCHEIFHISTNQFGIFDLKIGTMSPGQFTVIPWGTSKYFIGVAIDPTGGNTFGPEISNQEFISVPYALYAEKAGNTIAAQPVSITTSTNATVTSPGTNSFNISIPNYVSGPNVTITPIGGNNFQVSAGGASTATPQGLWTGTLGSVYLVNPSDNVGIGINPFMAKLDVMATTSTGIFVSSPANGILAVTSSSSPSNCAVYGNNQGGNLSGPGVAGVNSSSTAAAVSGTNSGTGPGVYGLHQNNINSSTAHGVYGETNSQSTVAGGVLGVNNGSGPGVYGFSGAAAGGPGVWGVTNSGSSPGVYGINNNGFAGVVGEITSGSSSSSAYGVMGKTNSTNSVVSAVYGQNTGAGHGVYGLAAANSFSVFGVYGKNVGLGGGVYGESFTTNNTTGAVHGNQTGAGVALRGSLPTGTAGGGSNAALLIENGHIWATSVASPTLVPPANNSGTIGIGAAALVAGSNDVRGMVTLSVTPANAWGFTGYMDFTVQFSKPYSGAGGGPFVTIAKYDQSPFLCEITTVTTTFVTFRVKNASPSVQAPNVPQLRFMYMVMN